MHVCINHLLNRAQGLILLNFFFSYTLAGTNYFQHFPCRIDIWWWRPGTVCFSLLHLITPPCKWDRLRNSIIIKEQQSICDIILIIFLKWPKKKKEKRFFHMITHCDSDSLPGLIKCCSLWWENKYT